MIRVINDVLKDKDTDSTYLEREDKNVDFILNKLLAVYPKDVSGISAVEIETLNRCNNDCSFCPVNRNADTRPYHRMTEELFYKIIGELANINYSGEISIFSNNEPLLDTRIFDFIDYAKKQLPKAHHSLYTNGTLLNKQKFERLIASLDTLYIDNYDDDMVLLKNVEEIINDYKDKTITCDVLVLMRKKNQILDSRGGSAPNRLMEKVYTSTCIAPFMQLIVRPDGKISRCCQDPLGKTTLGDFNNQTIQEIWEGELYNDLRNQLQNGLRSGIEQCKYCDVFGNTVAYTNKDWQSRLINVITQLLWEKKTSEHRRIYLYGNQKQLSNLINILTIHGIEISGIIHEKTDERLLDANNYILFSKIDCIVLDEIDPDNNRIGADYLICNMLMEVFDGEVNKEYRMGKNGIKDLVKLKDSKDKKVYFWGTGKVVEKLIKLLEYKDEDYLGFLDNNEKKWGTDFMNKKIINPQELKSMLKDSLLIIVASSYCDEIKAQLLGEGLCDKANIIDGYQVLKIYDGV